MGFSVWRWRYFLAGLVVVLSAVVCSGLGWLDVPLAGLLGGAYATLCGGAALRRRRRAEVER